MRARRSALLVQATCGALVLAAQSLPVSAQSLETFVLAVGGDSSGPGCATWYSHPAVTSYFGNHGVSIPVPGLGPCSVAGDFRHGTASSGPIADTLPLSTAWSGNSLVASTAANADYGSVAARASCHYVGITYPGITKGAEACGIAKDALTVTSPTVANGAAGWIRVWVTVEGGLSLDSNGLADLEVSYWAGGVGPYTLVRCQANFPTAVPFLTSGTGGALSGFTLTPGAMSGAEEIDTFLFPIVFGTPLDFRLGLLSYVIPNVNVNVDCDFRARLTRVQVYGPTGQPLTDFKVASASGAAYGESGLLPVNYCTAGTSGSGCQAAMSASGVPSASSGAGFVLTASGVEGKKLGLFMYGASGRQAIPWGTGSSLHCVATPFRRSAVQIGSGTPGLCDGQFALDYNAQIAAKPSHNPGPGALVQAQLWYRDPFNPSSTKTSMSDALEFFLGL